MSRVCWRSLRRHGSGQRVGLVRSRSCGIGLGVRGFMDVSLPRQCRWKDDFNQSINQEIFNVANIAISHYYVHESVVCLSYNIRKWFVEEECLQTLAEDWKWRDDWTSTGSVFQSMAAATGKERRPTVDKRNGGTCSWCVEEERSRRRLGRSETRASWHDDNIATASTSGFIWRVVGEMSCHNNNNNNPLYLFVDKPLRYASQQLTRRTALDKPWHAGQVPPTTTGFSTGIRCQYKRR